MDHDGSKHLYNEDDLKPLKIDLNQIYHTFLSYYLTLKRLKRQGVFVLLKYMWIKIIKFTGKSTS